MLLIKNGTVNTITQGIQKIGILIKDKKIVSSANGAMYELENGQTKYDKLTQIQENDIYNIYKKVLTYSY